MNTHGSDWMDTRATLEFLSSLQDDTAQSLPKLEAKVVSTLDSNAASGPSGAKSVPPAPVSPATPPPVKPEYRSALRDPELLRALTEVSAQWVSPRPATPPTRSTSSPVSPARSKNSGAAVATSKATPPTNPEFTTRPVESVRAQPKVDERRKWQRRDTQPILRVTRDS